MNQNQVSYRFGPPLTAMVKTILIANIAFFLLVSVILEGLFDSPLAFYLYRHLSFEPRSFLFQWNLWQPFTYAFVHREFFHIFWNMITLFMFGSELEALWGRRPFFLFYLLCAGGGALGMLAFWAAAGGGSSLTMGASGAIMGCVVAYGIIFSDRMLFLLFPPIPIKAKYMAMAWVVIDLIMFVKQPDSKVAYMAHLGGALMAFLYMKSKFRFAISGPFRLNLKSLTPKHLLRRQKMKKYLRVVEDPDDPPGPTFH